MEKNYVEVLGFVAGTLTTVAFFPQALKSWRTKSAKDISLAMFPLLVVGIVLWMIYGLLINSFPLIIFNSITLAEAVLILYVKIKHG
ncbi:MAG: SemiSWEET transporter [Nitrospinae bacterium]|nr:SemiSWEET transporter [Nitrospinota bacterium]